MAPKWTAAPAATGLLVGLPLLIFHGGRDSVLPAPGYWILLLACLAAIFGSAVGSVSSGVPAWRSLRVLSAIGGGYAAVAAAIFYTWAGDVGGASPTHSVASRALYDRAGEAETVSSIYAVLSTIAAILALPTVVYAGRAAAIAQAEEVAFRAVGDSQARGRTPVSDRGQSSSFCGDACTRESPDSPSEVQAALDTAFEMVLALPAVALVAVLLIRAKADFPETLGIVFFAAAALGIFIQGSTPGRSAVRAHGLFSACTTVCALTGAVRSFAARESVLGSDYSVSDLLFRSSAVGLTVALIVMLIVAATAAIRASRAQSRARWPAQPRDAAASCSICTALPNLSDKGNTARDWMVALLLTEPAMLALTVGTGRISDPEFRFVELGILSLEFIVCSFVVGGCCRSGPSFVVSTVSCSLFSIGWVLVAAATAIRSTQSGMYWGPYWDPNIPNMAALCTMDICRAAVSLGAAVAACRACCAQAQAPSGEISSDAREETTHDAKQPRKLACTSVATNFVLAAMFAVLFFGAICPPTITINTGRYWTWCETASAIAGSMLAVAIVLVVAAAPCAMRGTPCSLALAGFCHVIAALWHIGTSIFILFVHFGSYEYGRGQPSAAELALSGLLFADAIVAAITGLSLCDISRTRSRAGRRRGAPAVSHGAELAAAVLASPAEAVEQP